MYNHKFHQHLNALLQFEVDFAGKDNLFYSRFLANASNIQFLYDELYSNHKNYQPAFEKLLFVIINAYKTREKILKQKDNTKQQEDYWFLSNQIAGMSLYVDRFCGTLANLPEKFTYLQILGVNLLHLMPLFESPQQESDGGYAVSNFRKIDNRFGTLDDLKNVQQQMIEQNMYLMLDIVLNHTSRMHSWALKAKEGDAYYQEYFYFFDDRTLPDEFEKTMPEIFPGGSPGNFTYIQECNKWVMTVFHRYQWDLNFTNPCVLVEMIDNILFYANLGIDILRIDAPAFIWKQLGTTCQNLPEAHTILRLIKLCVQVAAPGMALLGEAIVAPKEIMKYFGTGNFKAMECDFAYNATHMALQWDALATGDTRIMMAAQHELLQKPYGTSWITYTRCHDDIGLGYDDYMIWEAGFDAYQHRKFLKDYYSGVYFSSSASGALFAYNPKTQDARISGSLASLCGLEKALIEMDADKIETSVKKIILMQAHSFFIGGIPMIFYGDEAGYTNDYSYLEDASKSYDNRWMHRPVTDWEKNKKVNKQGSIEHLIYASTQRLLSLRKQFKQFADTKNIVWLNMQTQHACGFKRSYQNKTLYCLFNFSNKSFAVTWQLFHEADKLHLYDHWHKQEYQAQNIHEPFVLQPYSFHVLEPVIM